MKFNITSELTYEVFSPTTFIFNIQAARSVNQVIIEEAVYLNPFVHFKEFELNNADARFIKLEQPHGTSFTLSYYAQVDVQYRKVDENILSQFTPVIELDEQVLPYLFPSRHCQSDKLRKFATKVFGHLPNQYLKVNSITNWIFNHIDYVSGTTDSGTSAYDTLIQREGVCKDFAHLGIALCRALDIPARYLTAYAYKLNPPDFHACFEAYIGGHWIIFDPTKLVPLNGLVKIANGQDATETAVASFFGSTNCTYMNVQCNIAEPGFMPFTPGACSIEAVSSL
jgi:transglutaminase-like putative cysteine protease